MHEQWWEQRIERQREIDASIAAKADFEYLYDKPYTDNRKVRVAGPFTVESLSPHRVLGVDEDDELMDGIAESTRHGYGEPQDFGSMILDHLAYGRGTAGAQGGPHRVLLGLTPWPGEMICAQRGATPRAASGSNGTGGVENRAGIFIGPEFGTVSRGRTSSRPRARRPTRASTCSSPVPSTTRRTPPSSTGSGRVPVLKARMNADLHMAGRSEEHRQGQPVRHLRRA